jgi:hypothetical protein
MREQILIFNMENDDLKNRLRRALMPLRVRVRAVSESDYAKPIGEIAGLSHNTNEEAAPDASAASDDGTMPGTDTGAASLTDPMMVFVGLSSARLDAVLRSLRKNSVSIPYKAILTESNAGWKPQALLAELKKEHAMTHPQG